MNRNAPRTIVVTREELYRQVWETPMSNLCKTYGLSDVGLAKVCKRYDIPRPSLGYWAKREHGKQPPRTPLPDRTEHDSQSITFCIPPEGAPPDAPPSPPPPIYDDDVAKMLDRVRQLPPIQVSPALRDLHPLIRDTRDGLEECRWPKHNLLYPVGRDRDTLNVHVSRERMTRALCFLNTLIRTIEKLGGHVSSGKGWRSATVVTVAGEVVASLHLREHYNQRPHVPNKKDPLECTRGKYDYVPNGRFVLETGLRYCRFADYQDTNKTTIEEQLNEIVIDLVRRAGDVRIRRRQEEEERKRREEEEQIRRQRAAELQRRREELQRKQRAEQARVDRLVEDANAWVRSQQVRAYIRTVYDSAIEKHGRIEESGELDEWVRWATQQADRIDPLVPSPPSILDERV